MHLRYVLLQAEMRRKCKPLPKMAHFTQFLDVFIEHCIADDIANHRRDVVAVASRPHLASRITAAVKS